MKAFPATAERGDRHRAITDRVGSESDAVQRADMMHAGRRLIRMARSIESFLLEQSQHLDVILDRHNAAATQQQTIQAKQAEFELQQAAWQQQRNEELQLIEQERTKLGQEWVRLEAEQRRQLAEEALRRTRASTIHTAPVAGAPQMGGDTPNTNAILTNREETSPLDSGPAATRNASLVEYEQLRNDVQKHARRRLRVK